MSSVFLTVEKLFTDEFYKAMETTERRLAHEAALPEHLRSRKPVYGGVLSRLSLGQQRELSFCCDDNDERNIMIMTQYIKQVDTFQSLEDRDIFIVLIFLYYSLRYNDQTEDWLKTSFLMRHLKNKELGKALYLSIATGSIILNGGDLASAIRKFILEIPSGGRKKSKKRKSKKRKSKKRKSKKRKY